MSDWLQSRNKARFDRRERLDELTARIRYEVRQHLAEAPDTAYDNVSDVFALAHGESAQLLEQRRLLPLWERLLLARYVKRIYGTAVANSVHDVPLAGAPEGGAETLADVFRTEIAGLVPDSGDTGAKYDMQGRGLLNVFRLAVGAPGEVWKDRPEVTETSARNVLTCSSRFLKRKPWHVLWPAYRVRGLRLWKL